jgi:hypothetical protein
MILALCESFRKLLSLRALASRMAFNCLLPEKTASQRETILTTPYFVSATRTPSCKDLRRNAMLRHDQALKEGLDEVAKAGFRAGT